MAVSDVVTHGLLQHWQIYMREDEWFFNQARGEGVINSEKQVYLQPDRDMIARAINNSYEQLKRYLGYTPALEYQTNEIRPVHDTRHLSYQQFVTRWGHLQAFGKRATTLLEADAPIVYSSVYNPVIDDRGTITVAVPAGTEPGEVQVFFRVADGAPSAANNEWMITPASVTVVGTVATIIVRRADCVKPSVWFQPFTDPNFYDRRNAADPTNPADFITAVDVYRVFTDPTDAVQIGFQQCATCALEWRTVEACIIDPDIGLFEIHTNESCYTEYPAKLRINYLAGIENDPQLLMAVFRYANTIMPRCPAEITDFVTKAFNNDTEIEALAPGMQNNPLGVYRGQVAAWQIIKQRMLITP